MNPLPICLVSLLLASAPARAESQPQDAVLVENLPQAGDARFPAGVPRGSVHALKYPCAALGIQRDCWIYTPPGFAGGTAELPLLVLQHAGADTHKTWVEKGKVDWLLDELIAGGKAVPMVVLMIDGHPKGEWVFMKEQTREGAMRDLERELLEDAIPLAEKHRPLSRKPALRAWAGPSVGGGQVISIALRHLDKLSSIGVFSMGHANPSLYQPALADADAVNARLKLFWIACSTGDKEFPNNQQFVDRLKQAGIHHHWYATEGGHDWPIWRRDLGDFLTHVFKTENP